LVSIQGGSLFKVGKNGHSRIYQDKQPEDKSTTNSQKSMDFFVQYNSKIDRSNYIIIPDRSTYLITPEGALIATKQLTNSTNYEAVEGVRQFDDLKEIHNLAMTLQLDKSEATLEQIKNNPNEITLSPATMTLSKQQLDKIAELRKDGHSIF